MVRQKRKDAPKGKLQRLVDRLLAVCAFDYDIDLMPEEVARQLHGAAFEGTTPFDNRRRTVEVKLLEDGTYQFRIHAWTESRKKRTKTATANGTVQWDNGSTVLRGFARIDEWLFIILAGIVVGVVSAISSSTLAGFGAVVALLLVLAVLVFGRRSMISHRNDILQAVDHIVKNIQAERHLKDKNKNGDRDENSESLSSGRKKRR